MSRDSIVAAVSLGPLSLGGSEAAARLLAERQRLHRSTCPVATSVFEEPERCRAAVEPLLQDGVAIGASRGDRLVGFVVATVDGQFALIPAAGHAVDPAESSPGHVYGLMYAELASGLVERGAIVHDAAIPSVDALESAWNNLGFGRRVCIASRSTAQGGGDVPSAAGVRVREAGPNELEAVARLASLEVSYRARSPMFMHVGNHDLEAIRAHHEELAAQGTIHFLAEIEGEPVGLLTLQLESRFAPICSENGLFVGPTATDPRFWRRGVGSALVAEALHWARSRDYLRIDVSFLSANLLSARFWPRFGFETIGWKMSRRLSESLLAVD